MNKGFLKNKTQKRAFGLSAKLVLSFSFFALAPIIINFISVSQTIEELKKEAIGYLERRAGDETEKVNLILSKVAFNSKVLADYATEIFNHPEVFYHSDYWSISHLFQDREGQWGNDATEPSSVIVFNWYNLNNSNKQNLELSANLDFVFPVIRKENPNLDNIYLIGDQQGWYRFYPVDFDPNPNKRGGFALDTLPADLNKEVKLNPVFWENLNEINNPGKLTKWSPPYIDVTGHGLMVSALSPVYQNNKMVAVLGVDMRLEDITNQILDIKLWKTGYAFMIDSKARPISLPVRARADLEWEEETLSLSETRERGLDKVSNSQLREVINLMKSGHRGLEKITISGKEKYVAYAPIENTGWSLGLVVSVEEIVSNALATRNFIFKVLVILAGILIVLIFFSSRLITAPIKELTKGASEISRGKLDYQIKIKTDDEIQDLAQGFNEMARKLKAYYATLEQKVQDRTKELTLAKNQIEQEKNRIEAILISIADGIFVIDYQKRLVLLNPAAVAMTGFEEKDYLGQPFNQILRFLTEKEKNENIEFIERTLRTGNPHKMTNHTILIAKDKKEIPVSCSAAAIKNENKQIIGAVGVFRDVTKEREIDRIKSEFVSLASHQLRTPVTIIKWGAEALLKTLGNKLKPAEKDQVDRIYRGSERMIELVNDLLNVSRLESGKTVFKKEEVQFEELVNKVVKEYQPYLEKKNIKLLFEKPSELLPKINIDLEKTRQVIVILLDNAVKYSPDGSEIKIKIEKKDNELIYSIKDNGVGIPKNQQEKIFSRFFRAENVSQKPGTGLGLYLAKGLIEAQKGKIWFESEGGQGTKFNFTLPFGVNN